MTVASVEARASMHPVAQAAALSRRSILGTARQPAMVFPAMFFPMLIAAVNSAALGKAIHIPGFPPVDSYLDFILPATIVQGVMFGAVFGGSDLALDIENGFFDRLIASPVWRASILIGRLAGGAVLGAVQAIVFSALFLAFGVTIQAGVVGWLVLMAMGVLLAVGIGGFGAAMALRTGNTEAVQSSFPLVFIMLFISSAFFPTTLMHGWYQELAQHNPITWMIDGARTLVISGFSGRAVVKALAVPAVMGVVSITLAVHQLRRRLAVAA